MKSGFFRAVALRFSHATNRVDLAGETYLSGVSGVFDQMSVVNLVESF
jgi:hypothetical protein